jgi:anti-sigma B factor antagonist
MPSERGLQTIVNVEGLPEGYAQVFLKGQLTWTHVKQFQSDIRQLFSKGYTILEIDLAELTYLDSSGLGAFLPIHKMYQEAGGRVKITNPRRLIRHLLVSAHLDTVLEIGPEPPIQEPAQ